MVLAKLSLQIETVTERPYDTSRFFIRPNEPWISITNIQVSLCHIDVTPKESLRSRIVIVSCIPDHNITVPNTDFR